MDKAMSEGTLEVRLEKRIEAPASKVWKIVSCPEGMGRWLGTKTFEPKVGGRVLFDVLHDGTRWLMFGSVQEMSENRSISFTWQEFDTSTLKCWQVPTLVTLTIDEQDGGCTVRFVHSGFDALPEAKSERDDYEQGWIMRDVLSDLAEMTEQV